MAFKKEKARLIQTKLLSNFLRGDYVAKAVRDVDMSRQALDYYLNKLAKQGFIFLTCGDRGRTFVNFTTKGKKLLEDLNIAKSL